jgi:hypothetical protein
MISSMLPNQDVHPASAAPLTDLLWGWEQSFFSSSLALAKVSSSALQDLKAASLGEAGTKFVYETTQIIMPHRSNGIGNVPMSGGID